MTRLTKMTHYAARRHILALAISVAALAGTGMAHAANPGHVPTPPPPSGSGGRTVGGVGPPQHGYTPQSLTPTGTPNAPLPPESAWEKFKDSMLHALADLNTNAGEMQPNAVALNAAIHQRDVRVAGEKLPQHMTVAAADKK